MQNVTNKKDFIKEFSAQRKKVFIPAILFFLSLMGMLAVAITVIFFLSETNKPLVSISLIICLIILVTTAPFIAKLAVCPNCKKYMGRDLAKFCPNCGVKIQK